MDQLHDELQGITGRANCLLLPLDRCCPSSEGLKAAPFTFGSGAGFLAADEAACCLAPALSGDLTAGMACLRADVGDDGLGGTWAEASAALCAAAASLASCDEPCWLWARVRTCQHHDNVYSCLLASQQPHKHYPAQL